jgi:hypothetical protein
MTGAAWSPARGSSYANPGVRLAADTEVGFAVAGDLGWRRQSKARHPAGRDHHVVHAVAGDVRVAQPLPSRGEPLLGALTGHADLVVALVGGDRLFQSRSPPVGELLDAAREGADPYSGSPFSRGARSFCSARRFPVSAMSVM